MLEQACDSLQDYSETHCREHFVCTFICNVSVAICLDCVLVVSAQGCILYCIPYLEVKVKVMWCTIIAADQTFIQ